MSAGEATLRLDAELFVRIAGRDYPVTVYTARDEEAALDRGRFAALLRRAAYDIERGEGGGRWHTGART
ncbi:hypothetical protein [Streptomyces sp. STCH 565 A]|uniref:hypothetical protein n=1 Tax=Streptomyces sp. STCH 565 A TaxID=2950532 RepID=UPI002075EFF8|nr:hypothetical protein [Streptomyces sp. STCH 565 A]MCM8550068.1 hypothetical protein [Streptomyces sp. STCH 565 A]